MTPARYRLPAGRMISQPQMFGGMGQPVTQGNWLAPGQVNPRRVESARRMVGHPQFFGMGQPLRLPHWEIQSVIDRSGYPIHLPQAEVEAASSLIAKNLRKRRRRRNTLGGLGSNCMGSSCLGQAAQGTYLAPGQLPRTEVQSAKSLVSENKGVDQFLGMGQALTYADPTAHLRSAYTTGQITLPTFVTAAGKQVGQYAHPDPKLLQTAYVQRQAQLPAFYAHPTLGPWGVDPMQAYQYWQQQLQAMQQSLYASPMSVWQSPGITAYSPPQLPATTVAQPAAFNPYSGVFPVAGTAVEKF
jgi:hypothetical protein